LVEFLGRKPGLLLRGDSKPAGKQLDFARPATSTASAGKLYSFGKKHISQRRPTLESEDFA
jgi:hypothetical protein